MTAQRIDPTEVDEIEALAREAEISLTADIAKKDLKEKRKVIKLALYGSNKQKHLMPKEHI